MLPNGSSGFADVSYVGNGLSGEDLEVPDLMGEDHHKDGDDP